MNELGKNPDELLPGPFISYSRRDLSFARKLYDALRLRNRDAWVDLEGIEPSEEWLNKLYSAIDSSQAFVFVISEDALNSPYCEQEIRRGAENNKKLIPVLHRQVDATRLPPAIAKLQWISFLDEAQFESRVDDLIRALDTDLEWTNEHTRLLVRAREWDREKRDKSYLLRGKDLKEAEQWLLQSGKNKERQPSALQMEFIGASIQSQKRSRNQLLAGVSAAAVIAGVLAVAAFYQRNQAQQNARSALSRLLAAHATNDMERNLNLAILLAIAGHQQAPTFESRQALLAVIHGRAHLAKYFYGHSERIHRLAFDSGGELLAASSTDGSVIVLNVCTGQLAFRSKQNGKSPPVLALSSEAKLLGVGSADGSVHLLDIRNWELVARVAAEPQSPIGTLAFSRDGRWLAWGGADKKISVWDTRARSLQCISAPSHKASLIALRFGADGQSLASMDYSGATVIWSTEQCSERTQVSLGGSGRFGAISSDLTKTAVTQEGFPEVFVTDLLARKMERLAIKHSDFLLSLEFHPVDQRIALGTRDALIHLWQSGGNKIIQSLRGHRGEVTSLAFDNKGQKLASGTLKGEVILWDLSVTYPMELTRSLKQPAVASVSFLPDGQRIVGITRDGKAGLWDLRTAKTLPMIGSWPASVKNIALSRDGERIAAQTSKSIMIRATKDGALLDDIPIAPASETALVFSPDGRHLAFADDGTVFLWSLERRTKIKAGVAAKEAVAMTFAPVGQKLAFTGSDRRVTFFDWQAGKVSQLTVPAHTSYIRSLAISGDGKILATGGGMYDGNISLWDSSDGRLLRTLQPNDPTDVTRLFFSPDSRTLASITAFSDQLRLWDVASGRLIAAPIRVGESLDAAPAAFSPEGALLATVEKESIVLRDLNPTSWIKAACQAVNRNLTMAEWKDYVGGSNYQPPCPQFPTPK